MILSNALLRTLFALAAVASDPSAPADRRDQLAHLSQRLVDGDASAIDDILACTQPSSPDHAPTSAQIERLRLEVERLRARPAPTVVTPPAVAGPTLPRDPETTLREARAWLRANDPNHCLKSLPEGDGEALYRKACALERLNRDEEALEAYRRVAAAATTPLMKQCAASGIEHVEWRLRRARKPETKS